MDEKTLEILNMLDNLSSDDLQRVINRSKILIDRREKEAAEKARLEEERLRREEIEKERKRREEIAELQRRLRELQGEKADDPEKVYKATGDNYVVYDIPKPEPKPAEPPKSAEQSKPEPKPTQVACPGCGQMNPVGSAFCLKCGKSLSAPKPEPKPAEQPKPAQIACPGCGQENPVGSAFCLKCGKSLSAPKPEPKPAEQPKPTQVACPGCGQENPVGSTFCLKCGKNLSGAKPEQNAASSSGGIIYADESMKEWDAIPGEKEVKKYHEVIFIKPAMSKKKTYYMAISDKRILFKTESTVSKSAKLLAEMNGGLIGSLISDGMKGPKPYLSIPFSAITDCGLQNKKEFFITAGETFVIKNNGYEKIIPELVRKAKMQ